MENIVLGYRLQKSDKILTKTAVNRINTDIIFMGNVINITVPTWNIEAFNGYKPITSFWSDFSIADHFGEKGIKDTFQKVFEEWKGNYKYLTELVLVLNHKIWQWYEKNETIARLYNNLWQEADSYACENLKGEEMEYFYMTTD